MPLEQEAQNALKRLSQAQTAQATIDQAQALRTRREELQRWVTPITTVANRVVWLRENEVTLTPVPGGIANIHQLIQNIRQRFQQSPTAETLLENNRWQQLKEELTAIGTSAQNQQTQDWRRYFSEYLFGGVSPAERANTLSLSVPENQQAFTRYQDLYQGFNRYRTTVPNTPEQLRTVQDYSRLLSEIRFVENTELPEAVRTFLAAISTGGASLDCVTPEVIAWLRDRGTLDKYTVRAR